MSNSTFISCACNFACYTKGPTPPACLEELAAANTTVSLSRSYICLCVSVAFTNNLQSYAEFHLSVIDEYASN